MSTTTTTQPEVSEARAKEVKRWEGYRTVLCMEGEGLGRHGTLTKVILSGGDPFAITGVRIDFGEEGVWLVEPELVTLPADDGPRWFETFAHCWVLGDNIFGQYGAYIEVMTDKPDESEVSCSSPKSRR